MSFGAPSRLSGLFLVLGGGGLDNDGVGGVLVVVVLVVIVMVCMIT